MRRAGLSLVLILFLTACAPASVGDTVPATGSSASSVPAMDSPTVVLPAAPEASVTPPAALSPSGAAPAPDVTPISNFRNGGMQGGARYELRLTLDYAGRTASVDETITYPNRSGKPLDELVLAVEPRLWPGAFILTSSKVDGQASSPELNGQRMTVRPAQPLAAGETVTLEFEFQLQIPAQNQRYTFGYTPHQVNLLDWYPFVVPYISGTGWVLHEPGAAGEHLVYESADFDVWIRFADPSNAPVVAASAPGVADGEWAHYHLAGARGFALSASERFLTTSADAGGVRVTSYYFDGHQAAGEQAAKITAQAVQLFSKKFAPYPYETLNVVESITDDGMEADGMYFMATHFYDTYDDTLQNYLTALSAHETAHQWWYGLVGNDQAMQPWLDEALATYSERIFYETDYPDLVNWWWNFRIKRFNPSGSMDANIYTYDAFRPYTNAVYFVGAYFLEDLRYRIGDEDFFAALSDYAKKNSYQIATRQSFFDTLDQHTNVDYSDIVDWYFQ